MTHLPIIRPERGDVMNKLGGLLIGFAIMSAASGAQAVHPPPARILDPITSPACMTVVTAFWLNKTLSQFTGGEGPAIAVKNTCEKPVVITEVLISPSFDVEKVATTQIGLAQHSPDFGYHGAFLVPDGDDCAAPLAHNREANKTRCKNFMLSPGETVSMPMKWGHGFTVTGFEANAPDKKFSVQGVLVDPTKPQISLGWLTKAAERGDAPSQLELGNYYGKAGDTRDSALAFKWYGKAALQGLTFAQYKLAQAFDKGDGTAQDFKQAVEWYGKAAATTNARDENSVAVLQSKCRLGTMYAEGLGVAQDHEMMARMWAANAPKLVELKPAADQGDAEAQLAIGNILRPNMNCRSQANAEAAKWYRKAADQGLTDAEYYIGRLHDAGEGLERSDKEAMKWYLLAAAKGHAQAQYQLGMLYGRRHDGLPADMGKSLKWITLAAYQGHGLAAYHLASYYANAGKDDAEALFWYGVPMKYEDRLDDKPGMGDVGIWRLSVLDPYATQREKVEARLSVEQRRAVSNRLMLWKPKTPEQSAADAKLEVIP